jgi:hypothetical protein
MGTPLAGPIQFEPPFCDRRQRADACGVNREGLSRPSATSHVQPPAWTLEKGRQSSISEFPKGGWTCGGCERRRTRPGAPGLSSSMCSKILRDRRRRRRLCFQPAEWLPEYDQASQSLPPRKTHLHMRVKELDSSQTPQTIKFCLHRTLQIIPTATINTRFRSFLLRLPCIVYGFCLESAADLHPE